MQVLMRLGHARRRDRRCTPRVDARAVPRAGLWRRSRFEQGTEGRIRQASDTFLSAKKICLNGLDPGGVVGSGRRCSVVSVILPGGGEFSWGAVGQCGVGPVVVAIDVGA